MKKLLTVFVLVLFSIMLFTGGCSNDTPESSDLSEDVSGSQSGDSTQTDISETSGPGDGSSSDESGEISSGDESSSDLSEVSSTPSVTQSATATPGTATSTPAPTSSTPAPTSSTPAATPTQAMSNIYARFKLTGGSGDVLLKDMDNLGYVGTCPLEYVNTQTNETIRNAEWKTDGKFAKYFNALHTATTILFDASEDAPEEERSTRMRTEAPFTVAAWINTSTYTPAGSPDFRIIAAYGSNGPIDHWDFKLLSNNELSFYHSAVASTDQPYDSGYILNPNTWYHVAVQFSETKITYFVNGNQVFTKNFSGEMDFISTRGNFAIGGLVERAYSFRGGIAEVAIYKGIVAPKDTTKYSFS